MEALHIIQCGGAAYHEACHEARLQVGLLTVESHDCRMQSKIMLYRIGRALWRRYVVFTSPSCPDNCRTVPR